MLRSIRRSLRSDQSVIEEQVTNGVAIRMAVLDLLAGERSHRMTDTERHAGRPGPGEQQRPVLLRGARIVDPSQELDGPGAVLDREWAYPGVGTDERRCTRPDSAWNRVSRCASCPVRWVVAPGLVDLHTHLREPGFEAKETILTGAAGGGPWRLHDHLLHAQYRSGDRFTSAVMSSVLQAARAAPARVSPDRGHHPG